MRLLILTGIFFTAILGTAQVTNNTEIPTSINDNGQSPDASAILDVQSTDKGVLFPRMTLTQRTGISNPSEGLLVYQTDDDNGFYYYSGGEWSQIVSDKKLFDPSLPFGSEDLEGVHVAITSNNSYTVPANSNFYGIIDLYDKSNYPIYINSEELGGYSWTKIFLGPGDVISTNAPTSDKVILHGYTGPDELEVLFDILSSGQSYTVPTGKQLFLERININPLDTSREIYVDGHEVKWLSFLSREAPGIFLLVEEGSVITSNITGGSKLFLHGYFK